MSLETSENLSLPYILPSQAQKHVTHNEAVRMLDALVQLSIVSNSLSSPPIDVSSGARYIVGADASGDWSGHLGDIAAFQDGAWAFLKPRSGWLAVHEADGKLLRYDGLAWSDVVTAQEMQNLAFAGINATADEVNRLSIASAGSLFSHDGTSHRLAINKQTIGDTASLVFQNNWSARAEIGLAGDDALAIKTSADGAAWIDAMRIDPASGNVGIGAEPTHRLRVKGGYAQIGWNLISAEEANGGAAMEISGAGVGDRFAYFDFHACDELSDYSSRFIRWPGQNAPFAIYNQGSGGIDLVCQQTASIRFSTATIERVRIDETGNVGIGTSAPTANLHVEGVARLKPMTMAELPSAVSVGQGGLAYVTDRPGGAGLMTSNGSIWQ